MDRIEIIQRWIDEKGIQSYLEIGCQYGVSFLPVKVKRKFAVDPQFKISKRRKLKWAVLNPVNLGAKYFEMESDRFFAENQEMLKKNKIGVALVDGLHTYHQALTDVLNVLPHLPANGLIVMHDCYPPHSAAATPGMSPEEAKKASPSGWNGEWCGDTWKAVMYLRKFVPAVEAFVLDCDYGLGIVKKRNAGIVAPSIQKEEFDQLKDLGFEEMIKNQEEWIGLRDANSFNDFIEGK